MKVAPHSPVAPDGTHYWSLTVGKVYEVLGIEADRFRLLDDENKPFVFDPACFTVVDASEPERWVSTVEDGVRYAYPEDWGRPGFFEKWHDAVPEVLRQFREQLSLWHPETARERFGP